MGFIFIAILLSAFLLLYLFLNIVSKKPTNVKNKVKSTTNTKINSKNENQIVHLPLNSILFDAGMDVLQDEAIERLQELASFLLDHPNVSILVKGISDSTGNIQRNKLLAKNRASKSLQYLKGKGIDISRLEMEVAPSTPGMTVKERENLRAVRFEII